jgi:hypothetical protein
MPRHLSDVIMCDLVWQSCLYLQMKNVQTMSECAPHFAELAAAEAVSIEAAGNRGVICIWCSCLG